MFSRKGAKCDNSKSWSLELFVFRTALVWCDGDHARKDAHTRTLAKNSAETYGYGN